jgi:hypothetical protein
MQKSLRQAEGFVVPAGLVINGGAAYEWCLRPDDDGVVMMVVVVSMVGEGRHRNAQHQNTSQ